MNTALSFEDKLQEHYREELVDIWDVEELLVDTSIQHESFTIMDKIYLERFLSLTHISLNGIGLESLVNFPALPSLKYLELNDNKISGNLEPLEKLFILERLELKNNPLTLPLEFNPLDSLDNFSFDENPTPITLIPGLKNSEIECKSCDEDNSELGEKVQKNEISGPKKIGKDPDKTNTVKKHKKKKKYHDGFSHTFRQVKSKNTLNFSEKNSVPKKPKSDIAKADIRRNRFPHPGFFEITPPSSVSNVPEKRRITPILTYAQPTQEMNNTSKILPKNKLNKFKNDSGLNSVTIPNENSAVFDPAIISQISPEFTPEKIDIKQPSSTHKSIPTPQIKNPNSTLISQKGKSQSHDNLQDSPKTEPSDSLIPAKVRNNTYNAENRVFEGIPQKTMGK